MFLFITQKINDKITIFTCIAIMDFINFRLHTQLFLIINTNVFRRITNLTEICHKSIS